MIGYVTLGTNNFSEAAEFYDALFATIGAGRMMQTERFVAWSAGGASSAVSIIKPFDQQSATVGNGTMVAIALDAPEKVDAFHAKALELGGTDDGAPGPRGGNFYVAYFRDLDGHKLNAFCMMHGAT